MSKHAVLNNIDHQALKVSTRRSAEFGDAVMCSALYPVEYRAAQACYPIVFHALADQKTMAAFALLGLEQNENLFLQDGEWMADYLPLSVRRDPFLIGFQQDFTSAQPHSSMVIHVDLASPRLSDSEGQPLFLPQGAPSAYTEEMASVLQTIHREQASNKAFIDTLQRHQLLEPFELDYTLHEQQKRLSGFSTINEQTLAALDKDLVFSLQQQGYLALIYYVLASQANIARLIKRKAQFNDRLL